MNDTLRQCVKGAVWSTLGFVLAFVLWSLLLWQVTTPVAQ